MIGDIKPDQSELIYVLTSPFEDERMPPPEEARPVTAYEYALLRRWIERGAAWPERWTVETGR